MAEKKQTKFKLKGIHKDFIINKLALHCGLTEIADELKVEFDIDVTPQAIEYYKREYEKEWREKRAFFNKNIAEIEPFADKVLRVKERGNLIRDIIENDDLWQLDVAVKCKQIVRDNKNNPVLLKTRANHLVVNMLLDSIHKELEPGKLALTDPTGSEPFTGIIVLPEKNGNGKNGGRKK